MAEVRILVDGRRPLSVMERKGSPSPNVLRRRSSSLDDRFEGNACFFKLFKGHRNLKFYTIVITYKTAIILKCSNNLPFCYFLGVQRIHNITQAVIAANKWKKKSLLSKTDRTSTAGSMCSMCSMCGNPECKVGSSVAVRSCIFINISFQF